MRARRWPLFGKPLPRCRCRRRTRLRYRGGGRDRGLALSRGRSVRLPVARGARSRGLGRDRRRGGRRHCWWRRSRRRPGRRPRAAVAWRRRVENRRLILRRGRRRGRGGSGCRRPCRGRRRCACAGGFSGRGQELGEVIEHPALAQRRLAGVERARGEQSPLLVCVVQRCNGARPWGGHEALDRYQRGSDVPSWLPQFRVMLRNGEADLLPNLEAPVWREKQELRRLVRILGG